VADWALHDLPDPNDFATDRASHLVLDLFLPLTEQGSRVPTDAVILIVWVFVPLLLILCASWLNGVFVAGWHAGRVRHPRPPIMALSCLALVLALFTEPRRRVFLGS
jgi:flagellar biosynthesis protein FliP